MAVYQLKHQIKDENGMTIAFVDVRRIKMKDIRAMEKETGTDADKVAVLISRLTGIIPPIVDELDQEDVIGISELLGDFQLPGVSGTQHQ